MATLVSANDSVAATAYTLATEVAAITSADPINTLDASQGMVISGAVTFTAGATPGTVTLRVRQGAGLAGAVVRTIVLGTTVASVNNSYHFTVPDPSPALVGSGGAALPVYTVSLQVAGAAATGVYASIVVTQPTGEN